MSKPVAVLISDIHYNINTLLLADEVTRKAVTKANELLVPLIVAGDIHDTKANMRAECINAMRKTFKLCKSPPYFIVGNHDLLNERSAENALNFLNDHGPIITKPVYQHKLGYLIPYHNNPEELRSYLNTLPKNSQLIMHQGIQGSNSGDYIQDKSAITKEDVSSFRVISGHYHQRHTIKLPENGRWDYIGNPFTLNFGEANDPRKGFQVLMSDGTLQFIYTNMRRHIVLNLEHVKRNDTWQVTGKVPTEDVEDRDLVLVKVKASREKTATLTRDQIAKILNIKSEFKLEYVESEKVKNAGALVSKSKPEELLDKVIDRADASDECKTRIKQYCRGI